MLNAVYKLRLPLLWVECLETQNYAGHSESAEYRETVSPHRWKQKALGNGGKLGEMSDLNNSGLARGRFHDALFVENASAMRAGDPRRGGLNDRGLHYPFRPRR
jgi:hypothetical protein